MTCHFGYTGQHALFVLLSAAGVVWFSRESARRSIASSMRALVCGSMLMTCQYHLLIGAVCASPSVALFFRRTTLFDSDLEDTPQPMIRAIFHHQPKVLINCLIGTLLLSRRRSHAIIALTHGFVLLHAVHMYWRHTHEGLPKGLPALGVTYVLASLAGYLSVYLSTRAKPLAVGLSVGLYRQLGVSTMLTWMDAPDLEDRHDPIHPHWVDLVDITTQDVVNMLLLGAVAHAVVSSHPTGRTPFAAQLSRPSVSRCEWLGLSAFVAFLAVCYQSPTLLSTFPFARLPLGLADVDRSQQRDLLAMDMHGAHQSSPWLGRCVWTAALMLSLLGTAVAARSAKRRRDGESAAASTPARLDSESVAADGVMPSKRGFVLSWLWSIASFQGAGASDDAAPAPPPEASLSATSDQDPSTVPSPFTSDHQRQQTSGGWAAYIEQQRLGSPQRPAKLAKVLVGEKMTAASFAASLGQTKRQETGTPAQLQQNWDQQNSDKKSEESTLRPVRSSDERCTTVAQSP